jgi:hypothetical protein
VPSLEEQEQFHRPDEEAVVKYLQASMRTWAGTQLAVATDVRLEADRMGYRRPDAGQQAEIDLPDDEDVITFSRPALLEWAARHHAEQPQ